LPEAVDNRPGYNRSVSASHVLLSVELLVVFSVAATAPAPAQFEPWLVDLTQFIL